MIRILITILFGLFLEPVVQSMNPTAEDLLEGAVHAIGGEDAVNSLESFKLHGIIRLPDGRTIIEIDLATALGGKVLAVQTFVGIGQTRFGSDGTTSWEENPNTSGSPVYTLIDDTVLSQKVRQLNWIEWQTSLPLQIDRMEVLEETTFDQESCWLLQIAPESASAKKEQVFFSKSTNRLIGRRTIEPTNDGDAIVNIYFRDWQKVGDLQLFHAVVFDREGVKVSMEFDMIELNTVDGRIFELPTPVIHMRDNQ